MSDNVGEESRGRGEGESCSSILLRNCPVTLWCSITALNQYMQCRNTMRNDQIALLLYHYKNTFRNCLYISHICFYGACFPVFLTHKEGWNLPMRNKVCNYWRREEKRQSSESDSPERSIGHFFLWSTQENNISCMKMFCFRVHALAIKSVLRISYLAALSSAVLSSVNGSWGSFLSW